MGAFYSSAIHHWTTFLFWFVQSTASWFCKYGCFDCFGYKCSLLLLGLFGVKSCYFSKLQVSDFFETSSMLISFILLGKYLEVLAKGKTSEAIAKLMNLSPETASLLQLDDEGNVVKEEEIDSQLIQKNDVIKILPGAKVACDGFVIWGQSHVNESMITGESRPLAKRKGDMVIGGTVNENGVLHIRATKVGSESALSQIVRLVESAQMAKAPVQKFADRISKYFVPLVSINRLPVRFMLSSYDSESW